MSETFQRFNLKTMSGVFPGTRTMVYQRVRLAPLDTLIVEPTSAGAAGQEWRWARLLWYTDPPSCIVELEASEMTRVELEASEMTRVELEASEMTRVELEASEMTRTTTADNDADPWVVRIIDPQPTTLAQLLKEALAAVGWRLIACGSCAFWQPLAARTVDGLPTGRCTYASAPDGAVETKSHDTALSAQSILALACSAWRSAATSRSSTPGAAESEPAALNAIAPLRKRAEQESDERWTIVGQVRRWLRRSATPSSATPPSATQSSAAPQTWEARIVERSGVGAGAEPCFACQGRIANLGALVVATPEGDKQTFSVWRCRICHTYYLNDWIDRWERTDSLETEERYYRLAPAEALEVLAVIDGVVHAEHPARRHERTAQRDWMFAFVGERPLLSHQVRQGR
jgi:hypothetical protein